MINFLKKTWVDRISEFPNRRTIKNVTTGVLETVDVTRFEGEISVEGDTFDSLTFNDLENRVADAFTETNAEIEVKTSASPGFVEFSVKTAGYVLDGNLYFTIFYNKAFPPAFAIDGSGAFYLITSNGIIVEENSISLSAVINNNAIVITAELTQEMANGPVGVEFNGTLNFTNTEEN